MRGCATSTSELYKMGYLRQTKLEAPWPPGYARAHCGLQGVSLLTYTEAYVAYLPTCVESNK